MNAPASPRLLYACGSLRLCFGEWKQEEMYICLIHVYVCIDMRMSLPTPPTNKPRAPEGQTSRHCCSLLGVPVALTELAERREQCRALWWADLNTDTCHIWNPQSWHCRELDLYMQGANTLPETQNCQSHSQSMLWQQGVHRKRQRNTSTEDKNSFWCLKIRKCISAEKQSMLFFGFFSSAWCRLESPSSYHLHLQIHL